MSVSIDTTVNGDVSDPSRTAKLKLEYLLVQLLRTAFGVPLSPNMSPAGILDHAAGVGRNNNQDDKLKSQAKVTSWRMIARPFEGFRLSCPQLQAMVPSRVVCPVASSANAIIGICTVVGDAKVRDL